MKKTTLIKNLMLVLPLALTLGCNSSSDDTTNSSTPQTQTDSGTFVDSTVAGLNYTCSSGAIGITDSTGTFECPVGDSIHFYLGTIDLGSVAYAANITPYTLFGHRSMAALNLAQLLQTLDLNNDPSDGIVIDTTRLADLLSSLGVTNLDFTSMSFDSDIAAALPGGITLVSEANAQQHLHDTLTALGFDVTPPVFTSDDNVSVDENQDAALTLVATDETSSVHYTLISSLDSTAFELNTTSGEITFTTTPDFETKLLYEINVTATDEANNSTSQSIQIHINDLVEPIIHNGVSYFDVTSPTTGRIWLDRNLGAQQVCTALNDTACYGDYYQWGRHTDGHEKATSAKSAVQATDINNAGDKRITDDGTYNSDWALNADNDGSLRQANWMATDGSSLCPVGFRVPTTAELRAETIDAGDQNQTDTFNGFLKIPASGYRNVGSGGYYMGGVQAYVWSTDISSLKGGTLYLRDDSLATRSLERAWGFSVRCIKD